MLNRIIVLSIFIAITHAHADTNDLFKNDLFKDEHIILQTLYNNPKKILAGGVLLTVIGLSLGHSNKKNPSWKQEGIAYGLIATGAILTKTGYTSLSAYNTQHDKKNTQST